MKELGAVIVLEKIAFPTFVQRLWLSGRMLACNVGDPSSDLGRCTIKLLRQAATWSCIHNSFYERFVTVTNTGNNKRIAELNKDELTKIANKIDHKQCDWSSTVLSIRREEKGKEYQKRRKCPLLGLNPFIGYFWVSLSWFIVHVQHFRPRLISIRWRTLWRAFCSREFYDKHMSS